VDATLHPSDDWLTAGHDRTKWVALMGIGAPLGIGLVAGVFYALRVRPVVVAAGALQPLAGAGVTTTPGA
jgi:hypothetical protein